MHYKKLFWVGFATLFTGFMYYKINYASKFPSFLPASPWISGFIRFFNMNPNFANDILKTYLGLAVGSLFVIFILTCWNLKK